MKYRSLVLICTIGICSMNVSAQMEKSIRRTLYEEVQQHPQSTLQDLYKFAYQAAMGNEHMMADTAMVRAYLQEEWNTMDTASTEPLVEYITNDSSLVRLNLRPYKHRGGSMEKIIAAMIQTAQSFKPSIPLLKIYLSNILALADDAIIPFDVKQVGQYIQEMESKKFPAVHHSQQYEGYYHPVYRVLSGSAIRELLIR